MYKNQEQYFMESLYLYRQQRAPKQTKRPARCTGQKQSVALAVVQNTCCSDGREGKVPAHQPAAPPVLHPSLLEVEQHIVRCKHLEGTGLIHYLVPRRCVWTNDTRVAALVASQTWT